MQQSVFVALPATPNDIPAIASLQYEACATDPFFRAIYPNPPTGASLAHLSEQYEQMMDNDPTAYMMIAKETRYGEIVSYAIWHFFPAKEPEAVEADMLADISSTSFPSEADANAELGVKLVKNSIRKRHEVANQCFGIGNPYAYLAVVGTNPKYQKQGAASKLVQWGVERADDQNLPIYIEGTAAGTKLYENHGFREYDRLQLDMLPVMEGDFSNSCLIRFPNTS